MIRELFIQGGIGMFPLAFFSFQALALILYLSKVLYFTEKKLLDSKLLFGILRKINWLSHIASLSTLTGLLGTVLGIRKSFQDMMDAGSLSLETFSSGIGQALLTTIFGLFIAISSLVFYHIFLDRLEVIEESLDIDKRN
jgi:hypothetical protein